MPWYPHLYYYWCAIGWRRKTNFSVLKISKKRCTNFQRGRHVYVHNMVNVIQIWKQYFPSIQHVGNVGWILDYILFFPSHFIQSAMKIESIVKCIMKAFLPGSYMFPIFLALAVEMDHVLASVWFNEHFSK